MNILVADDDFGSRLVVRAAVQALGHQCRTADDGEVAWNLFLAERPDVLITDWLMPVTDGLELCRRVRATGGEAYTYVIVVSSLTDRHDVLLGMEAGADDYLAKPVDPFDLEVRLTAAGRVTALHGELARYRAQLEGMNAELQQLAHTDPLTRLGNRLALAEDLSRLHASAQRYGHRYALAMCDIDCFKSYNDRYGHQAGDRALQRAAGAVAATIRDTDRAYRYGGEELVVVLPEQDAAAAVLALERVRRRVADLDIPDGETALTISVGVAAFEAGRSTTPEALLGEADAAMYRAKAAGRNRVVASCDDIVLQDASDL